MLSCVAGLVLALGLSFCVSASQVPFLAGNSTSPKQIHTGTSTASTYDDGLFTPLESLAYVSEKEYTTLGHPFFPKYSVRIKKSKFCDTTVNSYTGYIDIQARHIFFYFFESRNDPAKDDVIFWTNGGPGCSSSLGLFMELGPCRVLDADGPKFHKESWNTNANLFFVDQPIGTGFSYAEYGETVSTTEDAAKDIAAFVAIFFENFSQFKGRPFHMSGESYGGRYLPLFAAAVYDQNAKLIQAGLTPVNLSSVLIGNGMTDAFKMYLSYYDMTCSAASVEPILDIGTCVIMKHTMARCEKWMKEACIDSFDTINCGAATSFCNNVMSGPFFTTTKNPYDISVDCDGSVQTTLCYPATVHINQFLDLPSTRSTLGVDPSVSGNFSSCNMDVNSAFHANLDMLHLTADYVAALLERGIRVLIYVGEYDWICNWVGNERWTLALDWSGKGDFVKEELREWKVDGKTAGKTRNARNFTFATVKGAGHMVPYNKPKEALEMLQRWLKGNEL